MDTANTKRVAASVILSTKLSPDRSEASANSNPSVIPPCASSPEDLVVLHKYALPPNFCDLCALYAKVITHDDNSSTAMPLANPSASSSFVYFYSGTAKKFQTSFVPSGDGVMEMYSMGSLGDESESTTSAAPPLVSYSGSFLNGERDGFGTITIMSPDESPSPSSSSPPAAAPTGMKKRGGGQRGASLPMTGFSIRCKWSKNMPDLLAHPCVIHSSGDQYVGMVSIISNITSKGGYNGLAWARSARFVPDSTGEMLYSDRRRYCGEWQCGQRHGFGVEYDHSSNSTFIGGFQYDSRDGSGTLFNETLLTVFSGVWREGIMSGTAGLNINRKANTIQGHNWNVDCYEFDSATILRSRVVNGVWEPLFVSFDNTLALSATELLTQAEDLDVMQLLSAMMSKPDFNTVLSTFQRCFFFLYGACGGADLEQRPDLVESLSWCHHTGLIQHCFHGSVRERSVSQETFSRAVADISSFVFSVRLRLLSFVAAHPKACDVNVSREVLRVCWDRVFALVAPLLTFLSLSLQRRERAALHIASKRCHHLNLSDFTGKQFGDDGIKEQLMDELCAEFRSVMGGALSEPQQSSQIVSTSSGPLITFPSYATVTDQLRFLFKAKAAIKGDEAALMFLVLKSNVSYLLAHLRTLKEVLSGADPKFPAPSFVLKHSALYEIPEENCEDDVVALELVNHFLRIAKLCSSVYPQLRRHPARTIWPLDTALSETCCTIFRIVNATSSLPSSPSSVEELEKVIAEVSVDDLSATDVLVWVLEKAGTALHLASSAAAGFPTASVASPAAGLLSGSRPGIAADNNFRRSARICAQQSHHQTSSQLRVRGSFTESESEQVREVVRFLQQLKADVGFEYTQSRGDDDGESSPLMHDGCATFTCACDADLPPLIVRSFAVVWDACVLRIASSRRSTSKRKL